MSKLKPKIRRARSAYAQLNTLFPRAFPLDDAEIRPLALSIRDELRAGLTTSFDSGAVSSLLGAMQRHCSRETYQRTVIAGVMRVDLQGQPVEPVTPEGQVHAERRIAAILAARVEAEQRLAVRQALPKREAPPTLSKPKPQSPSKAQPLPASSPLAQSPKATALPMVVVKKRRTMVLPD